MPFGILNTLNLMRTITAANTVVNSSRRKRPMTYDDAFNKLNQLFKNGEYNGWELTDPDSLQACKSVDGVFYFVEFQEDHNESNAVFYNESFKVADFNVWDLWQHGRFYYETYEQFLNIPLYQKFECMFEDESSGEVLSAEEAYKRYLSALNQ